MWRHANIRRTLFDQKSQVHKEVVFPQWHIQTRKRQTDMATYRLTQPNGPSQWKYIYCIDATICTGRKIHWVSAVWQNHKVQYIRDSVWKVSGNYVLPDVKPGGHRSIQGTIWFIVVGFNCVNRRLKFCVKPSFSTLAAICVALQLSTTQTSTI